MALLHPVLLFGETPKIPLILGLIALGVLLLSLYYGFTHSTGLSRSHHGFLLMCAVILVTGYQCVLGFNSSVLLSDFSAIHASTSYSILAIVIVSCYGLLVLSRFLSLSSGVKSSLSSSYGGAVNWFMSAICAGSLYG